MFGNGQWVKPPRCESASCAEVRVLEETVEIRDSDAPGVIVSLSHQDWMKLIQGVKVGFYDLDGVS